MSTPSTFPEMAFAMQYLLTVCPCCGNVFRVVEGELLFRSQPVGGTDYDGLLREERAAHGAYESIEAAEFRFQDYLSRQRERRLEAGRRKARKRIASLSLLFSDLDVDPKDVRVVFDPVDFIVFRGLAVGQMQAIELVARKPDSLQGEKRLQEMEQVIKKRSVFFEVLRLDSAGACVVSQLQNRRMGDV